MMGTSEDFIVVMRMWKKWSVGIGLMLMGTFTMTPLIALETTELSFLKQERDFKPLSESGIKSGISENLNPWEIEGDTSNCYRLVRKLNLWEKRETNRDTSVTVND
ncbi:MAG: hypothetical protein QNJ64_16865 [Crocosphaera sp.]|nr:hypothetical protein [Crocosphaera sp.]